MSEPSDRFEMIGQKYEEIRATLDPSTQNHMAMTMQILGFNLNEALTLFMTLCGGSVDAVNEPELEGTELIEILIGVFLAGIVTGMASERVK